MTTHVVLDEFLVWQELSALRSYALAREPDFRTTAVVAGDDPLYREFRRSRALVDAGRWDAVVGDRIRFHLDRITGALDHPRFAPSRIEAQITASNHGDYYRRHDDNSRGCPPSRAITFVYFFHREPRPFGGGELVLYDPRGTVHLTPEANAMVLFDSSCPHEILPIDCPSRAFGDSRFTINGWVHR